jgi:hypothetical protein
MDSKPVRLISNQADEKSAMSAPVPPSVTRKSFSCPHCGAFSAQHWFGVLAERIEKDPGIPSFPDKEFVDSVLSDTTIDPEVRQRIKKMVEKQLSGLVFFEPNADSPYRPPHVHNVFLSECYTCGKIALWVSKTLINPSTKSGAPPNGDLPEDIARDYEEARSIVGLSPRGAAALLRLCIQKLCIHLGGKGERLDDDIGALVSKGLSPLVQQSLDIVRVIGNEAVHPGVLDLRDDNDTATQLFTLVNLIADQMISHPKHVATLYGTLPESKRAAIRKRDEKPKRSE